MTKTNENRIGFFGAGQMAQALASGMVSSGVADSANVSVFDPSQQALDAFQRAVKGANCCQDNKEVTRNSDVLVIAVKPHFVSDVARDTKGLFNDHQLVVSIAAGVTLHVLREQFGTERVVRVMPNTPCLVRQGASAFARGATVSEEDVTKVLELMQSVGVCEEVSEPMLDVVTGLSGSGPAYMFLILDAMIEAAVRLGLPRPIATSLAQETMLGAATLMKETGQHPAVLRDRVTSPGGTTAAGLFELEDGAVRALIMAAVEAAADRAIELGMSNE